MSQLLELAGVVACATLGFATLVQADAVTDWNAITMEAVQAVELRYEPSHFEMSNRMLRGVAQQRGHKFGDSTRLLR